MALEVVAATLERATVRRVYTGYTVSKVMVSLPQELVERLDRYAREHGTTRSGVLRELVERELARDNHGRLARVEELLGDPGHYGGRAAAEVRRMRTTR